MSEGWKRIPLLQSVARASDEWWQLGYRTILILSTCICMAVIVHYVMSPDCTRTQVIQHHYHLIYDYCELKKISIVSNKSTSRVNGNHSLWMQVQPCIVSPPPHM